MITDNPTHREMIRHTVATIVYRGAKTLNSAPEGFGKFRIQKDARTPLEILVHIGDLFDWSLSMINGAEVWHDSVPLEWNREVARFYASAGKFDSALAGNPSVACPLDRLFQGPIADALTHVGQLAMLRHLFGAPIKGENYFKADIRIGQVGANQPPPRKEF